MTQPKPLCLANQPAEADALPLVSLSTLTMRDIKWLDPRFVPASALTVRFCLRSPMVR